MADAQDLGSCTERCRGSTPLSCILWLVLLTAGARPLRADSITVGNLTFDNVHINRIEAGQVYYSLGGDLKSRSVADVVSLHLDDESDFNAAIDAYQKQQWSAAADGFTKTMSSTDKEWLKDWIVPRQLDAANHANRFFPAVVAWVRLVNHDPSQGAKLRPILPAKPGPELAAAAKELQSDLASATGAPRRLMLGLLLDVLNGRHDAAGADIVAGQLEADPALPADMQAVEEDTRLALIRTAVSNGRFDQALKLIDSAGSLITDPDHQSETLFLQAQALEAKTLPGASADNWKDVALAYIRVYVHFRDGPGSSRAPRALLKAAQIEETKLQDPHAALALYQKLASEYKDSPESRLAGHEITRLTAQAPAN